MKQQDGYQVLRGNKLNIFKELLSGAVTDGGAKTTVMGVFNFRATLNMAMVLTESERAKEVRSRILDIVIDVFTEKGGGNTKHINQRDVNYLASAYQGHNYRKEFTSAFDELTSDNITPRLHPGGSKLLGVSTKSHISNIRNPIQLNKTKFVYTVPLIARKTKTQDAVYRTICRPPVNDGLQQLSRS